MTEKFKSLEVAFECGTLYKLVLKRSAIQMVSEIVPLELTKDSDQKEMLITGDNFVL